MKTPGNTKNRRSRENLGGGGVDFWIVSIISVH